MAFGHGPQYTHLAQLFRGNRLIKRLKPYQLLMRAIEHAPAGLSVTAQGLFSAMVWGFGAAVGGLAGGPLLESVGGRGLHLVFGLAVLVAVAYAALMRGRVDASMKADETDESDP